MADSKSQPNRLRSLRDSVKKITKRLSEGEGEMIHKNSEQARELDKLRVQIQSMEDEIRRLYQSRYQLDQATKQNEKLVATLQDAKAQIEALRAEVEKLTAPPSSYAIFSSLNEDGTGNVYVSGRKIQKPLNGQRSHDCIYWVTTHCKRREATREAIRQRVVVCG